MKSTTKTCSRCKKEKNRSCYSKDYTRKSGLDNYCKECKKEYKSLRRRVPKEPTSSISKKCTKCLIVKDLVMFSGDLTRNDGKQSRCKECVKEAYDPVANSRYIKKYRKNPAARDKERKRKRNTKLGSESVLRRRKVLTACIFDKGLTKNSLLDLYGNLCYYCGSIMEFDPKLSKSKKYATHEHLLPISRGGDNTFANSRLACRSCNSKKNNKTLEEFKEYALRVHGMEICNHLKIL